MVPQPVDRPPVRIELLDAAEPEAQRCLHAYYAELDRRFDAGFDPDVARPVDVDDVRPPRGLFLVARRNAEAIGCGALKLHGDGPAEIKRMWVSESARGLGVGRRLLDELERRARAGGACAVRLDTNDTLTAAISLYRSAGYVEIDAFNDEPYADHWFEKTFRERNC